MRYLGAVAVIIFILATNLLVAAPASASTISVSHTITITARVAPAHYVIVDKSGSIIHIDSNTTEDIKPRIFIGKVAKDTERPLTPNIYKQYSALVPAGSSHVGTLYKKDSASLSLSKWPALIVSHYKVLPLPQVFGTLLSM